MLRFCLLTRIQLGWNFREAHLLFANPLFAVSRPSHLPVLSRSPLVLRVWLNQEQTRRLRDGKYMATVVRKENSCWIRGSLDEDVVFLMDNAHLPEDDPGAAGSFYNKAPRFSVLGSDYLNCEPFK